MASVLQSDTRRRCLRSSWSSESTPGSRAGSTLLHARLATAGYTCPAAPLAPRSPEAGSAGRGQPGPWGGRGAACALPRAAGEPHSPPRRLHAPLGCQNATASLNQRGWTFSPAASTCAGGGGGEVTVTEKRTPLLPWRSPLRPPPELRRTSPVQPWPCPLWTPDSGFSPSFG